MFEHIIFIVTFETGDNFIKEQMLIVLRYDKSLVYYFKIKTNFVNNLYNTHCNTYVKIT